MAAKPHKLPSGNWRMQIIVGTKPDGTPDRRSVTAPTEWEVLKAAEDLKKGILAEKEHMTVKTAVRKYIDSVKGVITPSTLNGYETSERNYLNHIDNIDIHKLTKQDIQTAISKDSERGLSYKTIKNALVLYHGALADQGVTIPPPSKFTLPQKAPKKGDLPEPEVILPIIIGSSVELPCLLSIWCGGLRISEVRGLQYRDITTDKNGKHFLRVNRVRVCISGHDNVKEQAKTVGSSRDVPVPEYVYKLIANKPHNSDTDFIVGENYGAIKRRFDRLMAKNGIEMTFHDLRKEFATSMNCLGVQKEVLQMLGGWSNSSVLDEIYIRTPQKELAKSMQIYDNYLSAIIDNAHQKQT